MNSTSFELSRIKTAESPASVSLLRRCVPYRTTDAECLPSWQKRMGLLIFAFTQNALSGGLIFGWASIDQTILSAPPEMGGAGLKVQDTTKIFTWATSLSMVAALLLGGLLDYSGPRLASIMSCLTISLGCCLFALSHDTVGFAVGTILIGFGGPGIGNCIIHLANLFPGNQNLIMSCLSGSIAFSFSTFAVFDMLWTKYPDLSFRHLFGNYSILMFGLGIGALILYPDEPFEEFIEDIDESPLPERNAGDLASGSANDPMMPEAEFLLGHSNSNDEKPHPHDPPHFTFVVEQPFNSYLRDKHRMMERTDSYLASKKSLAAGGPALSLKDQPLSAQLQSTAFFRASFVFLVTTFVTNFYVGSISTELMDRRDFPKDIQHQLTQWFTILMGMGMGGSLLVGFLLDRFGLEVCTAITLVLGQLQMLLILFGSDKKSWMILSFVMYTCFRAFLYPVFISSLTHRLGFKYFGILLGLGFAMSGVVQLLFPFLVQTIQGDCHSLPGDIDTSTNLSCDHGAWQNTEVIQFIILGLLYLVPFMDWKDRIAQEQIIRNMLLLSSPKPSYGSSSFAGKNFEA